MVATKPLTVEDLERIESDADTDARFELILGALREVAAVGGRHGEIGSEFFRRVAVHVAERGLGRTYWSDTGFVLRRDPDVVVKPDIAFVRADRLPPEPERIGYMPIAPDLVVEVVSTHDRRRKVERKLALYRQAGVPMTVVVEPDQRTMTVHRPGSAPEHLGEHDTFDGGDVLPGFRLVVGDVFR